MMNADRNEGQESMITAFAHVDEIIVTLETGEESVRDGSSLPRTDVSALEAASMAKGLAKGIVTVCEVLEIPLDEARLAAIEGLDVAGLERLLDMLAEERYWP